MKKKLSWVIALAIVISLFYTPLIKAAPPEEPEVLSEAAILINAKTGEIIYEKNAHEKYYPASITKLLTALLVIENTKPTDLVCFSYDAVNNLEFGSSHIGMKAGEQLTVDQALRGLLLMSANEVANAFAETISGSVDLFGIEMTKRAKALGALNSNFVNPHGLHDDQHYTTALDMALIMKALYNNPYFLDIMATPTYQIPPTNKSNEIRYLSQQHRLLNPLRDSRMFRSEVIGGKTGYTDMAKNTLVTAARKGDIDLIVVILKGNRSSIYKDTNTLLDFGFNNYYTLSLHQPGDILLSVPIYSVQSGKLYEAGTCEVSVLEKQSLLVPKSTKFRDLKTQIDLPEYVDLSIKEGMPVGSIDYIHNSKKISSNVLIASKVNFKPSPQKASFPLYQKRRSPFSLPLYLLIIPPCIIICFIFIYFINRPKKVKVKTKKIKFSKTIK